MVAGVSRRCTKVGGVIGPRRFRVLDLGLRTCVTKRPRACAEKKKKNMNRPIQKGWVSQMGARRVFATHLILVTLLPSFPFAVFTALVITSL